MGKVCKLLEKYNTLGKSLCARVFRYSVWEAAIIEEVAINRALRYAERHGFPYVLYVCGFISVCHQAVTLPSPVLKNFENNKKEANIDLDLGSVNGQPWIICGAFLWHHATAINTHPYTSVWTIHTFIRTQAQESVCLQWSKTKPTVPTLLKGPLQQCRNHSFLRDAGHVFIRVHHEQSDLRSVLSSPRFGTHRPQFQRARGNTAPFLSLPVRPKWRGCDAMKR